MCGRASMNALTNTRRVPVSRRADAAVARTGDRGRDIRTTVMGKGRAGFGEVLSAVIADHRNRRAIAISMSASACRADCLLGTDGVLQPMLAQEVRHVPGVDPEHRCRPLLD